MGLIDLFQKTRETSMEMKPQEDEAAKVVTCKGCGAELKAYAYGKNLYVCPHCGRYGRLLARTRIRQIDQYRVIVYNHAVSPLESCRLTVCGLQKSADCSNFFGFNYACAKSIIP